MQKSILKLYFFRLGLFPEAFSMKHLYAACLIISLFCLVNCREDEPQLPMPPFSNEGKNIFACKVNGKVFIAEGNKVDSLHNSSVEYNRAADGMTHINAESNNSFLAEIYIDFIHSKDKRFFVLNDEEHNSALLAISMYSRMFYPGHYRTVKENPGNVKILYYDSTVIAGVFEFDAKKDNGEIMHVTEGRFDISTK